MKKLQIIATTTFFGFAAMGQISYGNAINVSSPNKLAQSVINVVKHRNVYQAAGAVNASSIAENYKQATQLLHLLTSNNDNALQSISPQTCIQQVETLLNGAKQYHQSTYSNVTINSAMHLMELSSGLLYTGAYFADGCQTMPSITYNAAYLLDKAMELTDQNYRG